MAKTKIIRKYLFIAVKPEYADMLISGRKDIELRKIKPHVQQGDYVIIYASAPKKAVLGFGKIKRIIECSPKDMWDKYSNRLGINEQNYFSYYCGYNKAIGIELDIIKPIAPIGLEFLKKVVPNFHPPQIYRYVTNEEISKMLSQRTICGAKSKLV
ncbi:MAG: ASCH domain-containing protein [Prevotella sp.]|nr:ASCH domain-containing protein [Prevotella sp.]